MGSLELAIELVKRDLFANEEVPHCGKGRDGGGWPVFEILC
jgi:hypothetical protein